MKRFLILLIVCLFLLVSCGKNVDMLIQKLYVKDETIRNEAVKELIIVGEPAVEPLILSLKIESTDTVDAIKTALIGIGEPGLPKIIEGLDSPIDSIAANCADILPDIKQSPEIEDVLIKHLDDTRDYVRINIIKSLTEMKSEKAKAKFIEIFKKTTNQALISILINSFVKMGNDDAVKHMVNKYEMAKERSLRITILDALGKMKNPDAYTLIIENLKDMYKMDPLILVQSIDAAGNTEDELFIEPLKKIYDLYENPQIKDKVKTILKEKFEIDVDAEVVVEEGDN